MDDRPATDYAVIMEFSPHLDRRDIESLRHKKLSRHRLAQQLIQEQQRNGEGTHQDRR